MNGLLYSQEEEQKARESLLRYYYSECMAHGTYILTVVIGIFTFLEVLGNVQFPNELWQKIVISLGLGLLSVIGFRFVVRTKLWGVMATDILCVKPMSTEDAADRLKARLWKGTTNITLLIRLQYACAALFKDNHKIWGFFDDFMRKLWFLLLLIVISFFGWFMLLVFDIVKIL